MGEQNAKEFQKRTFFYGQDTWRVTQHLTLNLGLRWELYFPETVNGAEHGALMDLEDGYMHVAEVGQVPSDMGWKIDKAKGFDPRIGLMYQIDDKTVVRAGYGRSFDTGVFGSIFGHVVTQNLPVLANQSLNSNHQYRVQLEPGEWTASIGIPGGAKQRPAASPRLSSQHQGSSQSTQLPDHRCMEPERAARHYADSGTYVGIRRQ